MAVTEKRTLLAVHAHPDDECIGTGGILARYAAEGARTVLVTCTDGAVGEISDPALATRMGKAGRERVLRHFGWPAIAAKTVELYESLLTR